MPGAQDKGTGGVGREGRSKRGGWRREEKRKRGAKDAGIAAQPGTLLSLQDFAAPVPH